MATALRIILNVSLLAFFVSSMLGMGLSHPLRALLEPLRDVRFVLTALVANFIIAPGLAYLLTIVIPLQRPHAVGLFLLGCAAGAPFLPKLAEIARGDPALSGALMTLLTVATTIFMPLMLPLVASDLQASPWDIARPLLELILLPLVVGIVVRSRAATLAAWCQPALVKVANLSLVLVLISVIVRDFRAMLGVVGSGAIAAAAIFVATLFALGFLLGGPRPQVKGVFGLGTAARNVGAALVPASHHASDPKVITMLVVSTLVIVVVLFGAATWLRRKTLPEPVLT
jgi:predicted Na+-dependent transporter